MLVNYSNFCSNNRKKMSLGTTDNGFKCEVFNADFLLSWIKKSYKDVNHIFSLLLGNILKKMLK